MTQPEVRRFRKKPVVVEAFQWKHHYDSRHVDRYISKFMDYPGNLSRDEVCIHCGKKMRLHGKIKTLESAPDSLQLVCPGDWIIKGIKGEYYPCKPDIFAETYEEVDE